MKADVRFGSSIKEATSTDVLDAFSVVNRLSLLRTENLNECQT